MTDHTISDNSGIPHEYKEFFKRVDLITPQYKTSVFSVILWGAISTYLYSKLVGSEEGINNKPQYLIIFFSFVMLPFTVFIYKIYNTFHRVHVNDKPFAPPDYGVCFRPWARLTEKEKKSGIIGAIDMKCNKMNQSNYDFAVSKEIQNNTYYLIYTMLTLTLLFFPLPEDYPFNRNSKFVKATIKTNILLCLALLTSPVFMGRVDSSNFAIYRLYTDIMVMTASILLILITFIIYKILIKGKR